MRRRGEYAIFPKCARQRVFCSSRIFGFPMVRPYSDSRIFVLGFASSE